MSRTSKKLKLEIKYGDQVIIKKGFFRGLSGKAIDFTPKQENIYSAFGIEQLEDGRENKEDSYHIKLDDSGAKHWFYENDLKIKVV